MRRRVVILGLSFFMLASGRAPAKELALLNVSYDATREFYQDYNRVFGEYWRGKTGDTVRVNLSNGGSAKQARAVMDGLPADVVSLALAFDVDMVAEKTRLLPLDWQKRLPNNSSPYTSTILFLVRKGNPKRVRDWDDLIEPGISIITPNPKTSGGARWNYLAAWGYVLKRYDGDQNKARHFMAALFKNVPVLDSGARAAMTTFAQRGIGDVLLAWESEALVALKDSGKENFELVIPSVTILAEPPVALVDAFASKHGTHDLAEGYLQYLYTPEGQEVAARHFFRPRLETIAKKHAATFPTVPVFTIEEMFGGWPEAQKRHFSEGGIFDQLQRSNR